MAIIMRKSVHVENHNFLIATISAINAMQKGKIALEKYLHTLQLYEKVNKEKPKLNILERLRMLISGCEKPPEVM